MSETTVAIDTAEAPDAVVVATNYLDADLVEDLVSQIREATKTPAKRRALRTMAQGAAFAGLMAGGQVIYSAAGGHLDVKAVAFAAAQAFGTAVLSYLHQDKS